MTRALIVRHSFANPYWWGWHRFLYGCCVNMLGVRY